MAEEKPEDVDPSLTAEDAPATVTNDLPQSDELPVIDVTEDKTEDVAQQSVGAEESSMPAQESTAESTQESKNDTPRDTPTTEKSQDVQEDGLAVQESPVKEETPSDLQEEQKETVEDLPGAPSTVEHITELPTLQEEDVAAPPQEEFTEIITTVDERTPSNQQELEEIIEEEEVLDREDILSRCQEALSEQEKLKSQNQHLQHKLAEYLARKKMDDRIDSSNKSFGDQEQRYMKSLSELETLQKSYSVLLNEYLEQEKELSDQCSDKQAIVEQAYEECKLYKLDKSCTAIYSRTGKRITKQEMEQLESVQKKKETELIAVRLDNIKLQYKVQKCETQLKQKEELAEGLHMIDFEQLKIDNVNLNEKIEERNEDIIKLKKKITNAVQVLTHLKQKLQFVQVENCSKKERLKQIESVVAQERDLLTRTKQTRDALRMNNNTLRHKGGLVSHSTLLRDFEERKDQNEMLQEQLVDLQNRHSALILACDGLRKKLEQAKLVQS